MCLTPPPLRRFFYVCATAGAVLLGCRAVNAEPTGVGGMGEELTKVPKTLIRGEKAHSRLPSSDLIAVASRYLGSRNPTGFRGQWCAAFVSLVLRHAGYRPLPGNRAVDGLLAGHRLGAPVPGALIVRRHHVEIALGNGQSISGNWGGRVALHPTHRGTVILPVKS